MNVASRDRRKRMCGLVLMHLWMSVAIAFVLLIEPDSPLVGLFGIGAVSLWTAQCCLLAIWAVFGGVPHPWRFVAAVALIIVLAWGLQKSHQPFLEEAFFALVLLLCQAAPLWAARFVGLRLHRPDTAGSSIEPWRAQYSLRLLLEWTAGLALLLGLFHLTPNGFHWGKKTRDILELLSLILPYAPVTLTFCLLMLGKQWMAQRAVVSTVAIIGVTLPPLVFLWGPDVLSLPFLFLVWLACCAPFLWMSLLVLKTWGYRLVWRNEGIDVAPGAGGLESAAQQGESCRRLPLFNRDESHDTTMRRRH